MVQLFWILYNSSFNFKALRKRVNKYYGYRMVFVVHFLCGSRLWLLFGRDTCFAFRIEEKWLLSQQSKRSLSSEKWFFFCAAFVPSIYYLFIYAHSMINDAQPKMWIFCMLASKSKPNEKAKYKTTNKLGAKSHIIYLSVKIHLSWVQFRQKNTNNYSSWSNKKPINFWMLSNNNNEKIAMHRIAMRAAVQWETGKWEQNHIKWIWCAFSFDQNWKLYCNRLNVCVVREPSRNSYQIEFKPKSYVMTKAICYC